MTAQPNSRLRCLKTQGIFCLALLLLCAATTSLSSAQTFTILHSFSGPDGNSPAFTVVQGADCNFYGTTSKGGSHQSGLFSK
jgi:hypothetical protein